MTATHLDARDRALDPTARGVLAMLAAMACFSLNDALVKLAGAHLPASEIMVVRGAIATVLVLGVLAKAGLLRRAGEIVHPLVALRSLLEAAIAISFLSALPRLGLAEITTILQATPLIMTALSVVVCRTQVGWRRWTAVAVGFFGVLLVVRPSAGGLTADAMLALLTAALVAVRDLMTRSIPTSSPSLVVTFGATISVVLVGAGLGAAAPSAWVIPSALDFVHLAGAAAVVVAGNVAIVTAFRGGREGGDMTVIGAFRYSVILFAMILGWLAFGDRPDAYAFAGAGLIVASGLYALRRERVRAGATVS